VSARTAVEVADRRRDLARQDLRAGDPFGRAAAYTLAAQQTPPLVLAWSWLVSLARDGIRPAHVREALADALAGVDEQGMIEANETMGDALVDIGMALGLPRPTAQSHWGVTEILAAIEERHGPPSDPSCAEQMALYWRICMAAGDDPEPAAAKLLRVFDLAARPPGPILEDR
jgi:hypothetical protein